MRRKKTIAVFGAALAAASLTAIALFDSGDTSVPLLEIRAQSFQQRITAEGVLEAVRSTPLSAPPRTQGPAKIAWMVDDGILVEQGDVIVRFDPTEGERQRLEGEAALSTADSRIRQSEAQTEASLQTVTRDRELAQFELDMARNFSDKDPDIFSRMEIIEAQIDEELAELKLDHAEGRRQTEQSLAEADMQLFGIERAQAEILLTQANDALNALELRAPHDGIVIFVRDWRGNVKQVGDTVFSRQSIAELPALDVMKADVYVLEADAGGLQEGRPAELFVEAAPERSFNATIRYVDRMPKPKVRDVPVQYFSVTLGLDETDPEIMKPGQRVRATLVLFERDDAIVVPRQAVFDKRGKKIVYRYNERSGPKFDEIEVSLGPSSLGRVVIESGLESGDTIALRDPERSDQTLTTRPPSDDTPGSP